MAFEFRRRDYKAEERAYSLHPLPAEAHPLAIPSPIVHKVGLMYAGKDDIIDPLRRTDGSAERDNLNVDIIDPLTGATEKVETSPGGFQVEDSDFAVEPWIDSTFQYPSEEWTSLKKVLMQRFPATKVSNSIMKSVKVYEKSPVDAHSEELDDPKRIEEEGVKVISQQDYISRLFELKNGITHSWKNDDRAASLKLSIKVVKFLMDTSVMQFYPTQFILATDVMDLLGDLVWGRIKEKAEYAEDETLICSLPENFDTSYICDDAKDTCNNWFCRIGSIRELLPRIYLELALLPCWRFLVDSPVKTLQRLVLMIRGIADPLASAYCHLYLVHCAQKLPRHDLGYLITGVNDLRCLITHVSVQQNAHTSSLKDGRLLVSVIEPAIECMMKHIFRNCSQTSGTSLLPEGCMRTEVPDILLGLGLGRDRAHLFGYHACTSVIIYHVLKELHVGMICSHAMDILHLIWCNVDCTLDQRLNYKLLGLRLNENISQVSEAVAVVDKVIQVSSCYDSLCKYLDVLNAYLDIVLQNQMDSCINLILGEIFERVCSEEIGESAMASLESFFLKLLSHIGDLDNILSLHHFVDILDVMHGFSKNIINLQILRMATRRSSIQDSTTIYFLLEVSQALHDSTDFSNIRNDENQQFSQLISRFINMVDYGSDLEKKLSFLVECRGAFSAWSELKETLVHSCNLLAIKTMQHGRDNHVNFVKSCLTFSEVTIPSVPTYIGQMNLYLETAEVAMLGGLVSHSDGLINSATSCLQNFDSMEGLQTLSNNDSWVTSVCKLCSLITIVPGNHEHELANIPKMVFSFLSSHSWVSSKLKIKGLCALILMLAAFSQSSFPPYSASTKVISNGDLFYDDPTYLQDDVLLSGVIVHKIVDVVLEEPLQGTRGNLALEACNCIASSFTISQETSGICSKLLEIAKLSLSCENEYLVSTINYLQRRQFYGGNLLLVV